LNSQCICSEGWIGVGDFVSGSPACHLNVAGVRAIWGLVCSFHTLNIPLAVLFLLVKPKRHRRFYRDKITIAGILVLLSSIFLSALGFVRTIDVTRTIGTDPAATALFTLSSICTWSFLPLLANILLKLLYGGLRARNEEEKLRIEKMITTLSTVLPVTWGLCMLASISPLFALINPADPQLMYGAAAFHFLMLAFAMVLLCVMTMKVVPPLIVDIDSVLNERPDPRLESIRWKFKRFLLEIRNQALVQSTSAGLFGCWPYLQRYSSYEVPLA
jgi:hypothetical protein